MNEQEAYKAYRAGELSEEQASDFFGVKWEDVKQLERIENILSSQPEMDTSAGLLFK